MRDLLTYIGIAVIVLLTAAFAAPLLIDFDAYRGQLAEELASATGAQVELNGPISLSLLPTPRFSAENFQMSADFGAVRAEKAVFELSLPALIQGKLQFSQARLDNAELSIETEKSWLRKLPAATQFDNLVLRRAKVNLLRSGAPALTLEDVDLIASAPSLAGPFQGRGSLSLFGEKHIFSFASDLFEKGQLPLKASLTSLGETGRLELDGRLSFAAALVFEGQAKAAGKAAPGEWQAQAALNARLDGVEAQNLAARLGDGPLANKISGGGRYEARSGQISLDLAAPQIDAGWAEFFSGPLLAASASKGPLDLHLAVESLDWRGASWSQVQFSRTTGAPAHLQAQGPGGSRLDFAATPDKTGWRGKAQVKTQDFSAFAAALPQAAPLVGVKFRALDLSGDFALSPDELVLTGANLALDGARFAGELRFRPEEPGRRAFLLARLAAPALDLDAAPDLADTVLAGVDLDLALEAQTVKLARGGQKFAETGRIRAHFLRDGEAARLEKLDLQKIGGADLSVSGAWGLSFSGLKGEARLKAADLSELAQLLTRLFPGGATKTLAGRAKTLSPADLTAKVGGAEKPFELSGTLRGTKIAASFSPGDGEKIAASLDLAASDGGLLLNQLGAPLLLAQKSGPAHVTARAQSQSDQPQKLDVAASGDLAGLHGDFHGFVEDVLRAPAVEGDLVLSGDLAKILASFSAAPPSLLPVRLAGRLLARDGAVALHNLAGAWGGDKFAGDLTFAADGVSGDLRCDRLSAPALAALALGSPAPVKAGALWSSLTFAPVLVDPPRAKIAMETLDLQPFGGKARFDLALGPGLLSVSQARFEGFGGVLRGGFDLRREGGQVTLSGDVEAATISLKNPAFLTSLDGRLHFAGNGASAAALVGSLAGGGDVHAKNLVIGGADLQAPDVALAASEAGEAPFDAAAIAKNLDVSFAHENFRLAEADFSVRLAGGRLTLVREKDEDAALEFTFDLRDASMALDLSAYAQKLPEGWKDSPPRAGVIWSGAWAAPSRRVDSTGFVNAVAVRALEREQARIEILKAQDRERLRALSAPQQQAEPQPPAEPQPQAVPQPPAAQ